MQSTGLTPRWGFVSQETAVMRAEKLAEAVGCQVDRFDMDSTIECLREKDSQDLLDNEYSVEEFTVNLFPFVPTIDGNFLKADPKKLLKKKAFAKDKAVLLGSNSNEGFWSLMSAMSDLFENKELEDKDLEIDEQDYQDRVSQILWYLPEAVSNKSFSSLE